MPANYVLLERIELNASAASVTFANIPQSGYTDLKVVMSTRNSNTTQNNSIAINGSTTGFSLRVLGADGSTPYSANRSDNLNSFLSDSSGDTANTFSNTEFYFPNYTSNTNKSYSVDNVTENNATGAYAQILAGLWSNTAAITSITFNASNGSGNFVQYSTFSLYGLAALGTTPTIAPKASGGNIIDFDGTYWIHTFTTTGAFVPAVGLSCDVLVVAGGGGGGSENSSNAGGGGGGAGGYRLLTAQSLTSATNYTVTVGSGGAGGASGQNNGTSGSNSVFSSITSNGGGYGATRFTAGGNGGSGGGGGLGTGGTGGSGNTPSTSPSQGSNGGAGSASSGGGGGGASAAGSTAPANQTGGNGGTGTASSITGTSVTYAGGGGGGGVTFGTGGSGGGGNGGSNSNGVAGTVNTGGGGGGAYDQSSGGRVGGNGGSGVVIIRYLAA